MMAMLFELLVAAILVLGACITLLAAIGLLRLPDLFTRTHAASKAGTAGSGLLLLAVALQSGEAQVWIKCILAMVFFVLTAPVAAHLLAKAALKAGAVPLSKSHLDKARGSKGHAARNAE